MPRHTVFISIHEGWPPQSPANTQQTRYICISTSVFTLKHRRKDGPAIDQIASAVQSIVFQNQGRNIPVGSLDFISRKEIA